MYNNPKHRSIFQWAFLVGLCVFFFQECAKAQVPPPQKVPTYYQFRGTWDDSVQSPPINRATYNLRPGSFQYNVADSSTYQWTGTQWIKIRGNGGSSTVPGNPVTSVQFNSGGAFRGSSHATWDSVLFSLHVDSLRTRHVNVFPDTIKKAFITVHTINGDTATVTRGSNFRWLLDQSFTNPDGLRDGVVTFGWNVDGSGNRINPFAGGYSINMESHFLPGGGAKNFELHIPEVLYRNGDRSRLMSWTFNEDSVDGINHCDLRYSDMNWKTPNNKRDILVTDSSGKFLWHTTGIGDNEPWIMHNNLTGNEISINNATSGVFLSTNKQLIFDVANTGPYQFLNGNTGVQIKNANDNFLNPSFSILSSVGATNFIMHGDGTATFGQALNAAGVFTDDNFIGAGTGGTTTASAIIEGRSTTRGFLTPRMTTTQKLAISSPAEGLQVYDLTLHKNSYFNATSWINIPFTLSASFSATGTATTTFTVSIGTTLPSAAYQVNVTPTSPVSAALFYVTNKTTTTFDVVYLAGLTGAVTFDWSLNQ